MLEKMNDFFDKRITGYDEHQMTTIESAHEFYEYTAKCLPQHTGVKILDLGCGTGLELEQFFQLNPDAEIVGIDLAQKMLDALKQKFPEKKMTLIAGSYFDIEFGNDRFDAAVSVESLHHFTKEEKIPLYTKLCQSLRKEGYFILTDYFSMSDEEETSLRQELLRLKKLQGIKDDEFYHYDTPLTIEHETEALLSAGFTKVEILNHWGHTYTIQSLK